MSDRRACPERGLRADRNGMATPFVLVLLLVFASVAGAALYLMRRDADRPAAETPVNGTGAVPTGTEPVSQGTAPRTPFRASGSVIAGETTPFIEFNRADYEQALREGRVILLYFYANWCPICKAELPSTGAAFAQLELPNVVGFRVNYNDDETDDYEENLARQFGIAYQHTKVILKGGRQVLKNGETWNKGRYIGELTAAAE